jgi:Tol biopolymer transport system component
MRVNLALSLVVILAGTLVIARLVSPTRGPLSLPITSAESRISVRGELIEIQNRVGLSLVTLRKNELLRVDFAARSLKQVRAFDDTRLMTGGAVSDLGTKIAFTLDLTPGKKRAARPQESCFEASMCLAISGNTGAGLRAFRDMVTPSGMCWSHDGSDLVVSATDRTTNLRAVPSLLMLNIDSGSAQQIDGFDTHTSSQCWSPNDTKIIYTANKSADVQIVQVYDKQQGKSVELAPGSNATWSPDGRGVAVLHCPPSFVNCVYELIDPGNGKGTTLFATTLGQTPLWWSPDSRFVAYVSPIGPAEERSGATPGQVYRLRVRRLEDNSEDWVLNLSDTDVLEFQWTTNRAFATTP